MTPAALMSRRALVLAGCLAPGLAFARPANVAGQIIDFQPGVDSCRWIHRGRSRPVRHFALVENGDHLQVLAPKGGLTMLWADGDYETIRATDGNIVVWGRSGPTILGNAFSAFGDKVMRAREAQIRSLVGRGESPRQQAGPLRFALPDLARGGARVEAGERHIAIAWSGGHAPFSVVMGRPGAEPLVREGKIPTRTLILNKSHMIEDGDYDLVLRDAAGRERVARITARVQDPQLDLASTTEPEARALVAAARAATATPPRPTDAFWRLAPFRETNPTAYEVMEMLAEG
ncbi:hypothetical protein CA606_07335 [Caulobacter vibrioides]|uniref:Uncharacterized protein n=1 Tax=Caulobacter vibrioides TaxID=155892 RepID=A0A290MY80_CAUVI|nr:hypothetical protein [Caulobacter vibrioides]ATC32181.1 hypothetical protein CA606_07335 [Caulobacter vibrioides]